MDILVDEGLSKHLSKYHPLCCYIKILKFDQGLALSQIEKKLVSLEKYVNSEFVKYNCDPKNVKRYV